MRPLVKSILTLLLCSILGLAMPYSAIAQAGGLTINTTSPATLTVCGDADLFFVNISNTAPGTLTNVQIGVGFPTGINYISGTLSGNGLGNVNVSTVDSIHFDAKDLAPGERASYFFAAEANCDFFANPDSIFSNSLRVTTANGNDTTLRSAPYNLAFASLTISNITDDSTSLGQTITRCVTLTNGGQGHLSEFIFTELSDPNSLGVSNFRILPGNIALTPVVSGDTNIITFGNALISNLGDGDTRFERNESVQICYDIQVNECYDLNSELGAYWGCDGNICQDDLDLGQIEISSAVPNLDFRQIYLPTTCYGGPDAAIGKIIVTNNGAGRARDVLIDVAQSNGPTFAGQAGYYSGFDATNIQWKNSNGTVTVINPSNTWDATRNCLPANSKTRFQVLIPWIEPGEQDTLVFYQYTCCSSTCGNNRGLSTQYKYEYYNECNTNTYAGGPTNLNYYWGSEDDIVEMYQQGPTDIYPGNTYTYTITQSRWRFVNPRVAGAYFQIKFELPPELSFSGNANDVVLTNQFGTPFTPSGFSYVGNVVTVNYPLGFQYGPEKAEASIKVTANCNGKPGGSFDTSIKYSVLSVPDPNCACELCANSLTFDVTVHCPPAPCPNGGMISLGYGNQRLNYGSNDAPDDGLPDGGVPNTSVMRDKFLMFGDTMITKMIGVVETTGNNPNWEYGSLQSIVNRGAWLEAIIDSVRIVDASTNNEYSCALSLPSVSTISNVRTFDFDISIANIGGCLPANFKYEQGDTVEVIAYYRSRRTGGVVETTDILNVYSLSATPNGTQFACDTFSGSFTYVGYYYSVCCGPNFHTTQDCDPVTTSESYYLSIGNCCTNYSGGNVFKREYRYWARPSVLRVVRPTGFEYNASNFYYRRTRGSGASQQYTSVITPVNPNTDTLEFLLDGLFQGQGGTFPLSDEGFNGWWTMEWQPTCKVPPNQWLPVFYELDFDVVDQLLLPGSSATTLRRRDSVRYEAPRIQVIATPQTINGASSTATWDIEVQNSSNSSVSSSTWVSFEQGSGNITVVGLEDIATGNLINPVGDIFQLGSVPSSGSKGYRVIANYTSCNLDSITVYYGWDCTGYPVTRQSATCQPSSYKLYLQPKDAELQATLTSPSAPVDICESIPVELEMTSTKVGSVDGINALVILPVSGGISYEPNSIEIEYPAGSGFVAGVNPVPFGTNGWLFDINSMNATLQSNGLPGIQQPTQNSVVIRFNLVTDCDFVSGENFSVNLTGKKPCGQNITPTTVVSPAVRIAGVSGQYTTQIEMDIDTIKGCQIGKPLRISILNLGPNATVATDSVIVQIPEGLAFDGNFIGLVNAPPNAVPDIVVLPNGSTQLKWLLPGGVALLDSIVFEAGLMATYPADCKDNTIKTTTLISRNLFCVATGNNCINRKISGTHATKVDVLKPQLTLTNVSSSYTVLPNGDFEVQFAGTLGNNGLPIKQGDTTRLLFFCDADQNGALSQGDTQFGSFVTSKPINGTSVTFIDTFIAPSSGCQINCNRTFMAVVSPTDANRQCNCDKILRSITPQYRTKAAGDTSICPGESTALIAYGGAQYSWSPQASLSVANVAGPVASPLATTDYIASVDDGNGCIAEDTVKVVVFSPPVADLSYDFSCNSFTRNFSDVSQNGDGTIDNWQWDFGDNSGSPAQNPSHTYIAAGSYQVSVKVTDDNGCVDSASQVLVEPELLTLDSVNSINASCFGDDDGSLEVLAQGGTLPYQYSLDGGALQSGSVFGGLQSQSYSISAQDDSDCIATITLSVGQPDSVVLEVTNVMDASCKGYNDGGIEVRGVGGVGAYTFNIDGGIFQSSGVFNGLTAGNYIMGLTDGNGCFYAQTVSIDEPDALSVTAIIEDEKCERADGSIVINVNGGTSPYTFSWNNNLITQDLIDIVADSYTVVVTDSQGCSITETYEVQNIERPNVEALVTPVSCFKAGDGSIELIINGTTEPYIISWSGTNDASQVLTDLEGGDHSYTITDVNGCEVIDVVSVFEPPLTLVDAGADDTIVLGLQDTLNTTLTDAANVSFVEWIPSNGLDCNDCLDPIVNPLQGTEYVIVATDNWGCEYRDTVSIYIDPHDHVGYIPNAFTPNGDGVNDEFYVEAKAVMNFHMQVFDRWGEMVFETRNIAQPWNGEYHGKLADPGVYVYQVYITYIDRKQFRFSGSITLIR